MVFPKGFLWSAVLGGIISGIITMLSIKILEARERTEDLEEDNDNVNRRDEPITFGVQESTKLAAQEHDERFC